MFTAHGYLDGVAYAVVVDPDPGTSVPDSALEHGRAWGSVRVITLLQQVEAEGEDVAATPVGPGPYRPGTPEGILAALYTRTQVIDVTGDAPDVYPPQIDGVVQ